MHLFILRLYSICITCIMQFTTDLPDQIFVTLRFENMFEVFDLYLIDPLARLGTLLGTESRISDCLETSTLEILQIAWFPEGKCISGNLSGYQSYMEIRNTKSRGRKRRDCKNGCPMKKFIFNLLLQYYFW